MLLFPILPPWPPASPIRAGQIWERERRGGGKPTNASSVAAGLPDLHGQMWERDVRGGGKLTPLLPLLPPAASVLATTSSPLAAESAAGCLPSLSS